MRYNYFSYVAGMCCVSDQPKNVGHVLIGICIVLPDKKDQVSFCTLIVSYFMK